MWGSDYRIVSWSVIDLYSNAISFFLAKLDTKEFDTKHGNTHCGATRRPFSASARLSFRIKASCCDRMYIFS